MTDLKERMDKWISGYKICSSYDSQTELEEGAFQLITDLAQDNRAKDKRIKELDVKHKATLLQLQYYDLNQGLLGHPSPNELVLEAKSYGFHNIIVEVYGILKQGE